jgi:hypothetical protein
MINRAQADAVSGAQPRRSHGMSYVVLQVVLKEKFFGTGRETSRSSRA